MQRLEQSSDKFVKLVSSAVNLLESKGYEQIRADVGDYTKPSPITQKDGEKIYTPDLTAYTNQGKCYFEIVTKDKKEDKSLVGRWKLLARLAQLRNGDFYILVPRGCMRFTNDVLEEYNIPANILKLQTA